MKALHHLSAVELRDAFVKGDVKAVEIARYFLDRILKHNKELGAFLSVLETRALQKAEGLDGKRAHNKSLGKMAGIPVAIKDNMHVAGETTTCAAKFLKNYKAPFDATVCRLFEEEDALLVGKANMDEFGMGSSNENSAYFPAANPWDLRCVPGGSSGGTAAAIAARLALIGTGSDTGGSIRQPAGFCGIVGHRPTYGRVSRYGLVAFASSMDVIGPMTANVADAALAMEVIGRRCEFDGTSLDLPAESYPLSKRLDPETTIGVPWDFLDNLKPEIRSNFEEAVEAMKAQGAKIVDVDLNLCKYSIAVYYILATAEASTNLARFDGIRYGVRSKNAKTLDEIYEFSRDKGFGREVKKRIMLGTFVLSSGHQDDYYKKAQKIRTLLLDAFESAFTRCDAVMLPGAPSGAFPSKSIHDPVEMYLQDIFTIPAALAGLPAITVPSGYDSRGMPLGVQFIGPQLCDVPLIQCAYAYEQATRHGRMPDAYAKESP